MIEASKIQDWPSQFDPSEWPEGTLDCMDAELFVKGVFPMRKISGVPMWPSAFASAHVRPAGGTSQHAMNPLSCATDMHVSTYERLAKVFLVAQEIDYIGGIGLYFDTNTPMIHIDSRERRTLWLCVHDKDGNREYIYAHADPVRFYKELAKWL